MQATPLITGTCHSFEIIGRWHGCTNTSQIFTFIPLLSGVLLLHLMNTNLAMTSMPTKPRLLFIHFGFAMNDVMWLMKCPRWPCPADTRPWPVAGLLLGQRRRRWTNIDSTSDQRVLLSGWLWHTVLITLTKVPGGMPFYIRRVYVYYYSYSLNRSVSSLKQ